MDLTQIENMILEILSEEENINEGPTIKMEPEQFSPNDRPAMKEFLQKNAESFKALRKITKQAEDLLTLDNAFADLNLMQIQKIWQDHIKGSKPLPDGLENADVRIVKDAITGNEFAEKFGPLNGYRQMIANVVKTVGKYNLFEEELSPAMQKLLKDWEIMFRGVKSELEKLVSKPMLSSGKLNITPVKNMIPQLKTLKDAILDVKEFYEELPDESAGGDETGAPDTDGDGIPDEREAEAGTDPRDAEDPPPTSGEPEAEPETVDPEPSKEEALKSAFVNFRDKFYCDIPEGANRREETEALEKCRERGVAVTQNEQHSYIRALIDALEVIVQTEEAEAFRGRVTEAKAVNIKSYKQSVFNFYRKAQSIISFMEKAQENAGNRTGKLHLKRAIAKVKDLVKNSGIIYDDLRDLMDQVLKARAGSEETVTEELLDEKKSSAEKVEKVYNIVREIVQAAIEKIAAGTPGAIRDDLPELKKALKKLKKIEKLFPKGKLGGKKSTSPDKIADDYKEVLELLKEPVNDFYKLKNKISDRGTVDQIASSLTEFVKALTKMFKLEMPAEFKNPIGGTATPPSPSPTPTPAGPDASLEKARRKYGTKRFIKDMPEEDRESFLKFMALMMDAGILSEGIIDKLLGRHINFKKMFGSNEVANNIESAIKKLDKADRQRVVAILKQDNNAEAFANIVRSRVGKKTSGSAGQIGQIKTLFRRGRASYEKISRKLPDLDPLAYNAIITFHILATADSELKENNAKSVAKVFGRNTVKFQSKFGQVYSNKRAVEALSLMKRKMKDQFVILTNFFSNKKKELNFILKSIALGTKGKRIEFDSKNWRKLASADFTGSAAAVDKATERGDEAKEKIGPEADEAIRKAMEELGDDATPEEITARAAEILKGDPETSEDADDIPELEDYLEDRVETATDPAGDETTDPAGDETTDPAGDETTDPAGDETTDAEETETPAPSGDYRTGSRWLTRNASNFKQFIKEKGKKAVDAFSAFFTKLLDNKLIKEDLSVISKSLRIDNDKLTAAFNQLTNDQKEEINKHLADEDIRNEFMETFKTKDSDVRSKMGRATNLKQFKSAYFKAAKALKVDNEWPKITRMIKKGIDPKEIVDEFKTDGEDGIFFADDGVPYADSANAFVELVKQERTKSKSKDVNEMAKKLSKAAKGLSSKEAFDNLKDFMFLIKALDSLYNKRMKIKADYDDLKKTQISERVKFDVNQKNLVDFINFNFRAPKTNRTEKEKILFAIITGKKETPKYSTSYNPPKSKALPININLKPDFIKDFNKVYNALEKDDKLKQEFVSLVKKRTEKKVKGEKESVEESLVIRLIPIIKEQMRVMNG